jgi:hypothetical protein
MFTNTSHLNQLNQYGLKALFRQYFQEVRPAELAAGRKRLPYRRLWTPLVTLWGMVLQRLMPGQHCADVVDAFRAGAADDLDPNDPHHVPLSARMKSEQNAGYVQARERLALEQIHLGQAALQAAVEMAQTGSERWHGHAVRLIDGTTYRLRPRGDLVAHYGQPLNQYGASYWVTVKSVASFCLFSRTLVAHAEGTGSASEEGLVGEVMQADPQRASVYVGDIAYGHYRVVQVAHAAGQHVVVRLEARTARKHLRALKGSAPAPSGWDCPWTWLPEESVASEPGLSTSGVPGRLLYQRVTPPQGGRPVDLYLFTTLTDGVIYPRAELVALYALRWQVELHYRDMKTTLDMAEFDVGSAAMFQRELEVGVLTYNLICALLTQAARQANLPVERLSFIDCLRRIRDTLRYGVPAWVVERYSNPLTWLIERMARCRIPLRLNRVAHEPRAVRRRPQVFPALKTSRGDARKQILTEIFDAVSRTVNS